MEWISIEERLPEEGPSVLVGWAGHLNERIAHRRRGAWCNLWTDDFSTSLGLPTHWMPLPEPPEKSGPFWIKGGYGLDKWAVVHKHNRIHSGMNERTARTLCERLNKLWQQKGENDDQ